MHWLLLALLGCPTMAPTAAPPEVAAPEVPRLPRPPEVQAALDALGADGPVNRLALEASPYLRQHAGNPVDWFPWGDEALALARQLDRPILLSIGYATCHWCHVMEEESFEDPAIAAVMNTRYIPIKVDREARPDLDALYLAALARMGRRGGWPMTLWLTPEGEPFYAATYVPARDGDRGATKGFLTLLGDLADTWEGDRPRIAQVAADLTAAVRQDLAGPPPGPGVPGPEVPARVLERLLGRYDPVHGGPKGPQRFPTALPLRAMLAHEPTRAAALHTLHAIVDGGLHDPVDGGFHRYSTDPAWQVPHFEKMLYDNARLVRALTDAWQRTDEPAFADAVATTVAWMDGALSLPSGAFAAALDADSATADGHREEGAYYTVVPDELPGVDPARLAALAIAPDGPLDGRSVPRAPRPLDPDLAPALEALRALRATRSPPPRDTTAIAAWNGLAIAALAEAGAAFGREDWIARARRAAGPFLDDLAARGPHRALDDDAPPVLEDLTHLAAGLVALFEATGEARWLEGALALDAVLAERFERPEGAWTRTPHDVGAWLAREVPDRDGVVPSGSSVHPTTLLRLHALTGDDRYRQRADRALTALAAALEAGRLPEGLEALRWRHGRVAELVLVQGDGADPTPWRAVLRAHRPDPAVVVRVRASEIDAAGAVAPLLEGKIARDDGVTAYLCEQGRCDAPVTSPDGLVSGLQRWHADRGVP